MKRKSWKKVI